MLRPNLWSAKSWFRYGGGLCLGSPLEKPPGVATVQKIQAMLEKRLEKRTVPEDVLEAVCVLKALLFKGLLSGTGAGRLEGLRDLLEQLEDGSSEKQETAVCSRWFLIFHCAPPPKIDMSISSSLAIHLSSCRRICHFFLEDFTVWGIGHRRKIV